MGKYEKALAKARAGKSLEEIFPELKESEDERIRKEIIHYILYKADGVSEKQEHEWVAWLEKQKENPDRLILIGKAKSEKQVVLLAESNGDENIYWDTKSEEDAVSLLEKGLKFFGKQKPAVWSEEDERMRNQLVYDVEYQKKEGLVSAKKNKVTKALYKGLEECYDEKIAWLKSLPLNLKKKNDDVAKLCSNEWSEEDEKMYARVVRRYTDYEGVIMRTKEESVANKMLNAVAQEEIWLKALTERFNLQPKQEWSEKDELMRGTCIYLLEHDDVIGPWKNCIAWLKSLNNRGNFSKSNTNSSSWKPSEEQMGMLLAVINDPNNAGAESCHLMLQSLYADLQKLLSHEIH